MNIIPEYTYSSKHNANNIKYLNVKLFCMLSYNLDRDFSNNCAERERAPVVFGH